MNKIIESEKIAASGITALTTQVTVKTVAIAYLHQCLIRDVPARNLKEANILAMDVTK